MYVLDGSGASWSNRFWGQVEMVGLMRCISYNVQFFLYNKIKLLNHTINLFIVGTI